MTVTVYLSNRKKSKQYFDRLDSLQLQIQMRIGLISH